MKVIVKFIVPYLIAGSIIDVLDQILNKIQQKRNILNFATGDDQKGRTYPLCTKQIIYPPSLKMFNFSISNRFQDFKQT